MLLTDTHCKEDLIYVFPEMKLRGLVSNFVSDLDIPRIGLPFWLQQNSRPILEIYKSLTDTWM
jgi:hypothetical protein